MKSILFILSNLKITYLAFLLISSSGFVLSQTNDFIYTPLKSYGSIPEDFLSRSYEKIEADRLSGRTSLSKKEETIFFESIHYSIDELLHSGKVIFGDPVTQYVNKVADILLKDNTELRMKLRFYTIRSNTANAFATDQGIIFITTGLFSRLENEAQLAFVLGHEISHYTEEHVVNSFKYHKEIGDNISQLSVYSQENELSADELGMKIFLKAGYSANQISSVLSLLRISHLPFEQKKIDETYLSDSKFTVPKDAFPSDIYPIKSDEDYNDSLSSHPNIKRRKDNVGKLIKDISPQSGNVLYLLDSLEFLNLVELCRFESVRNDIVTGQYIDALYSIFLLEKEYPNSEFLKQSKCTAWLGASTLKATGGILDCTIPKSLYEGSSANLHEFIYKQKQDAILLLGMHIIDEVKNSTEDEMIHQVWKKQVELLAYNEIKLTELKSVTLKDTLVSLTEDKKKDRIIKDYYYFGHQSLKENNEFLTQFNSSLSNHVETEKVKDDFLKLSKAKKRKYLRSTLHLGLDQVIVLEPSIVSLNKKGVKQVKSEKLNESFKETIDYCSNSLEMDVKLCSSKGLSEDLVDEFNEKVILSDYLRQLVATNGHQIISPDFYSIRALQKKYSVNNILLFDIQHYYKPKLNIIHYGITFAWPPMGFILIPTGLLSGNNTTVSYVVLELSSNEIRTVGQQVYNDPANQKTLKAFIYDLLIQLNSKKK